VSTPDEPTTTTMEYIVLRGVPRPALSQTRYFRFQSQPKPGEGERWYTELLVEFHQARREGRPPPGTEEGKA
jgi:hypothetical protein